MSEIHDSVTKDEIEDFSDDEPDEHLDNEEGAYNSDLDVMDIDTLRSKSYSAKSPAVSSSDDTEFGSPLQITFIEQWNIIINFN